MPLEIPRFTISREDDVYQAFPDVVLTRSGRLLATWRASLGHVPRNFTDIYLMHSDDDGATWEDRRILHSGPHMPWEHGEEAPEGWWSYNCPRLTALPDGRIVAICDRLPRQGEAGGGDAQATNWLWLSEDNGDTWSQPYETEVLGIVPDRIVVLSDGMWICGTTWTVEEPVTHPVQFLWRSTDEGQSWQGPITVADVPGLQLCEGSFLELEDGTLVCMLRENSGEGLPGFKTFSPDGGLTWEEPRETLLFGCHRPVMGLLESGNILTTYRCSPGSGPLGRGMKPYFQACLQSVESLLAPEPAEQSGRILTLDHDRNPQPDTGYSGWLQLPDGRILVVYYIKDDAPMAQIRGCWLTEEDFVLSELTE